MTREQYDKLVEVIDKYTETDTKSRRKNKSIIRDMGVYQLERIIPNLWLSHEENIKIGKLISKYSITENVGWNEIYHRIVGDNIQKLKDGLRRLVNDTSN